MRTDVSGRWQRIQSLYHAARARREEEQAAFLDEACANDEGLRREVESLLAQPVSAEATLDRPALAAVVEMMTEPNWVSLVGRRLGAYQVLAPLGAGGMGEVYRARDMRLDRFVALKVLHQEFTDADDLARFEREARALAALNHPHIAAIYGVEDIEPSTGAGRVPAHALVLELIEGETLAERIHRTRRRGRSTGVPIDETLAIARQIADALEAAHQKGIVHRDLKPANIKITPEGTVKVLDFGLAKTLTVEATATTVMGATREGVVVGTAAYMSPEQARGVPVDERTDIWAFGCVLYEMLTGRPAFGGETVVETLSAVLSREPDWAQLPAVVPITIRRVVQRCVTKDARRRLHAIADARIEIEDALSAKAHPSTTDRIRRWTPAVVIPAAAALLGLGMMIGALFTRSTPAGPSNGLQTVRYTIPVAGMPSGEVPEISRDGRQIAFVASKSDGSRAIWVQALNEDQPRELPGTSGASLPFWSPDGRSLGFFAEGALKRVELAGGPPQRLQRAEDSFGGTWSPTGAIVFSERYALYQIPATGGTPALVANLDLSRQENSLRNPQFLPDGRRFLYVARSGRPENTSAYLASLDGSAATRLFSTRSTVRHASPNSLFFVRDDALVEQSFDADRRRVNGAPRQIVGAIDRNLPGPLDFFSVSDTGVLAYRVPTQPQAQLIWVDRMGRTLSTVGEPAAISNFRLSPDGQRVVLDEADRPYRSVWTVDLATGARSRLTFEGSDDWQPIWSPDGLRVLFGSYRNGPIDMYVKPANGSGPEEEFLRSSIQKGPRDWSKDGRFVLYTQDTPETKEDLFARRASGGGEPIVIAATIAREFDGRFSFDGRWVSYVSNESGTEEVYVQSFPPTGGKWQISNGGGHSARWREDGRELFYLTPTGEMRAVPVTAGQFPVAEPARPLFRMTGIAPGGPGGTSYEVERDGQRFLMRVSKGAPPPPYISVILNWAAAAPR